MPSEIKIQKKHNKERLTIMQLRQTLGLGKPRKRDNRCEPGSVAALLELPDDLVKSEYPNEHREIQRLRKTNPFIRYW